ncbi:FAD-dependent oxidoreductase [Aeoliella sp. SH292]|uniref:FAD-dependent oxidoreductase n=1 Tax=Aeoliella sp. SH292 TaxID=3454464 RepID=UPI003F974066
MFKWLTIAVLASSTILAQPVDAQSTSNYDVVVYGGTSAAVMAAVEVARQGKSVVVVSPDARLGGLTSNGLGWTDLATRDSIGGLSREFYNRVYDHYLDSSAWTTETRQQYINRSSLDPDAGRQMMFTFEPKVAKSIFEDFVSEENIPVISGQLNRTTGVGMAGQRITSISTLDGNTFTGGAFIDATYEGDLMAAAGVSYTVGRESNATYGETLNGIQAGLNKNQLPSGIDPYVVPGNPASGLLPGVNPSPGGPNGAADDRLQAYNFRMTMTNNPANRVAIAQPANYDEADYELLFRAIDAGQTSRFWKTSPMPNNKTDSNNDTGFSTDFIGGNYDLDTGVNFAEADYETREAMIAAHRDYQLGFVWTMQNHPRVPESLRNSWGVWGLPADEFTENGNWPEQIYVREARRMVSDVVINEHHVNQEPGFLLADSIALGGYAMDSHHVQRHVDANGYVTNEGDVQVAPAQGPYRISYQSIVPRVGEAENLLVPVAISSSHIAYGSIRMEPVFMSTGQAAGAAAVLALNGQTSVQDVEYTALRQQLLAAGAVLGAPVVPPVASTVTMDFNGATSLPAGLRFRTDGTGWSGAWDGTGTEQIVAGNLQYSQGGYSITQQGSGLPGRVQGNYNESRQNTRAIAEPMTGEVWFSFLVQNPHASAVIGVSLNPATNGDPEDGPIEDLIALTGNTLSYQRDGQVVASASASLAVGGTHLVVGRLSLSNATDSLRLWVNPDSMSLLGTPDISIEDPTLAVGLSSIGLLSYNPAGAAFSAAGGYLDALRISNERHAMFEVTGATFTADFNGNGHIDIADFHVLRNNFLTSNAGIAEGDTNGDSVVDHMDYFMWRSAFLSAGGNLASLTQPVPEPGTLLCVAIPALMWLVHRSAAALR